MTYIIPSQNTDISPYDVPDISTIEYKYSC
jgi:hypothetical protein